MDHKILFKFIGLLLALSILAVPALAQPAKSVYVNPAVPGPDKAAYWLDRGGLFSTYGNYPAAIKAYKKALELDPNQSETYFDLGLAYAEMNEFDQALEQINKAIDLAPDMGRYYYGRARVLLISGQRERAMPDFQKAADLGNRDALDYLHR